MIRGIHFENIKTGEAYHTGEDWDLVMSKKFIGVPDVKEKTVSLNDRDGVLDYTETLRGVPAYGTRPLSFTFEYLGKAEDWPSLYSFIRNFIHGKRLKIVEPDDHAYYFLGRTRMGEVEGTIVKTFTIDVTADTWRYKNGGETKSVETITPGKKIKIFNDWKPVVPTITTTGAFAFSFGGVNYSVAGEGTFRFPKIMLEHGANIFTVLSGSGTVTFTYQEGAM